MSAEPMVWVQLGIDGRTETVRITESEAHRLRRELQPFVAVGRRVSEPVAAGAPTPIKRTDLNRRLREARVRFLEGVSPPAQDRDSLTELVERAAELYASALTEETRASYARRWHEFTRWCATRELRWLPASADTVVVYLTYQMTERGKTASTLYGMLAAINRRHLEAGLPAPGQDPAIPVIMRGVRRRARRGDAEPISALRIEHLRQVLRAMPDVDPRQARDLAATVLRDQGLTYGDLCRLRWSDVHGRKGGLVLHLRSSVNKEPDRQMHLAPDTLPTLALRAWQALAGRSPELVFTVVHADGWRDNKPLRPSELRRSLERRADYLAGSSDSAAVLAGPFSEVLRDRALLLTGFAGAMRRNEVVGLRWSDIEFQEQGARVLIRRSKTDLQGRGREIGIPYGSNMLTCPVSALLAWKERMLLQLGERFDTETPCFPCVGRGGRIGTEPITTSALTRIVVSRCRQAGVDGHWGGRSLRAGFISTAADLDIPIEAVAAQSRHASLDNLVRYIRNDDPFRRNAAHLVGL